MNEAAMVAQGEGNNGKKITRRQKGDRFRNRNKHAKLGKKDQRRASYVANNYKSKTVAA